MLYLVESGGIDGFNRQEIEASIQDMCGRIALECGSAVADIPSIVVGDGSLVELGAGFSFTSTVSSSFKGVGLADSLSISFCPEQDDLEPTKKAIDIDLGEFGRLIKLTYSGGSFGIVELRPDNNGGLLMHVVDDEADEIARQKNWHDSLRKDGLIDAREIARRIKKYRDNRIFVPLTSAFTEEFMPLMEQALGAINTHGLKYQGSSDVPKETEKLKPKDAFIIAEMYRQLFQPAHKGQKTTERDRDEPNTIDTLQERKYDLGDCTVKVIINKSSNPNLSALDILAIEKITPKLNNPSGSRIVERYEIPLSDYSGSTYEIYTPNDKPIYHEGINDTELQAMINGIHFAVTQAGLFDLTGAHFIELVDLFQRCKNCDPEEK